jgi:HAD superfamily hydrolase (TIGR01484 family)
MNRGRMLAWAENGHKLMFEGPLLVRQLHLPVTDNWISTKNWIRTNTHGPIRGIRMRYRVLASDYDGTLADDGKVDGRTAQALRQLRASGRQLILVTGRELIDLQQTFSDLSLFEYVVTENGATLYRPATKVEEALAPPPPDAFVALLRERGVTPLSVGRTIVATVQPNEHIVLQTIRDLGLELQVIFNKGAVMVLPSAVNKGTGLTTALERMMIPPSEVVAIGDGENDHSLLSTAGLGIAVSNAVPLLQEAAAFVTEQPASRGVVEVIDRLLAKESTFELAK